MTIAKYIVVLLCFTFTGFAQLKPIKIRHISTEKEDALSESNFKCTKKNSYSAAKRMGFYPFSKAKNIRLVSFKRDSTRFDLKTYNNFTGSKLLSAVETDKLTDILYNYSYKGYFYIIENMNCYNPRNAILFLDESDKVFEYIEICFECEKHRASSEKMLLGDFCGGKYAMLAALFQQLNLQTQE